MSSTGTALRATVMGTWCVLSAIVTVDHTFHLPSSLKPFFDTLLVFCLPSRSSPFTCLGVSFFQHTTQAENKVTSHATKWSEYLSSPNMVLKAWRIPGEPTVICPDWKVAEAETR